MLCFGRCFGQPPHEDDTTVSDLKQAHESTVPRRPSGQGRPSAERTSTRHTQCSSTLTPANPALPAPAPDVAIGQAAQAQAAPSTSRAKGLVYLEPHTSCNPANDSAMSPPSPGPEGPSGAPARPASPGDDTAHNATSIVPMFIVKREGTTQVTLDSHGNSDTQLSSSADMSRPCSKVPQTDWQTPKASDRQEKVLGRHASASAATMPGSPAFRGLQGMRSSSSPRALQGISSSSASQALHLMSLRYQAMTGSGGSGGISSGANAAHVSGSCSALRSGSARAGACASTRGSAASFVFDGQPRPESGLQAICEALAMAQELRKTCSSLTSHTSPAHALIPHLASLAALNPRLEGPSVTTPLGKAQQPQGSAPPRGN